MGSAQSNDQSQLAGLIALRTTIEHINLNSPLELFLDPVLISTKSVRFQFYKGSYYPKEFKV